MKSSYKCGVDQVNCPTISKIIRTLETKGYTVINTAQPWRHLVAELHKDSRRYFCKLASTYEIGQRTANEPSWNNNIKAIIQSQGINLFDVPRIVETSFVDGNFYYVAEYIDGGPVAEPRNSSKAPRLGKLKELLPDICRLNHFIYGQSNSFSLNRDEGRLHYQPNSWQSVQKAFSSEANSRILAAKHIGLDTDLSHNLKIIFEADFELQLSLNHGDFAPWHIILEKGSHKLYLIDAEHASNFTPKYYDTAFFYHRLYTALECPQLAERYLEIFVEAVPTKDLEGFYRQFQYLLASRIIDGFLSHYQGDGTRLECHLSLQTKFLNQSVKVLALERCGLASSLVF